MNHDTFLRRNFEIDALEYPDTGRAPGDAGPESLCDVLQLEKGVLRHDSAARRYEGAQAS
jgi:hypothetical protein